ncbi:hypothetical protein Tco_0043747, partial [Tanacetum coccineum]
ELALEAETLSSTKKEDINEKGKYVIVEVPQQVEAFAAAIANY